MTDTTTTDVVVQDAPAVQQLEKARNQDLDTAARLGLWLAAAESNSNDPNARGMAAALRISYAHSLGLPAHAAQEIHLVKGNLTLSAKLCRALAHQHGLRVVKADEKADSCTAVVIDLATGHELGRTTYTLAQAHKAGIDKPSSSGKPSNWTVYPDRMLWARASKRALDDHAPWVTVGVVGAEEAEEMLGAPLPAAAPLEDEVVVTDADLIPFGED
jgi:hypothetical protein